VANIVINMQGQLVEMRYLKNWN